MPTTTLTNNDDVFSFDPADHAADLDNDTIFGLGGDDSIFGTNSDDIIYGGAGADTIDSDGGTNFPFIGSQSDGGDTVYGGAGDDVITSNADFDGPNGGAGSPTPSSIHDTVYGGTGNDTIIGNVDQSNALASQDLLYGGIGNDVIDGNTGEDAIFAEAGDDLVLARAGVDTTDGGTGIDTLDFTGDSASTVTGGGVVFDMTSGATTVTGLVTDVESNINYENVIGSTGNDSLTGTAGDNSIAGGLGDDSLFGGAGNDTFNSGGGNDTIEGGEDGPGNPDGSIDVLDYSNEGNGVVVSYTGDEAGTAAGTTTNTDTFSEIERIIFTDLNDAVNAQADTTGVTLDTQGGDDFVAAGQGNDSMDGGAGTDQLSYLLNGTTPVTVDTSAGTATGAGTGDDVFSNFENFNLTDGNDTFTGSAVDETVSGQDGFDSISTGGGTDTVDAGTGDDTVQGGAGADSLDGGVGIDTLSYQDSAAPVTVNLGANSVSGGDGTGDTITGFENVTGSAGGDNLTGSTGENTISGLDGDDQIDAGDGNDSVDAGAGNDNVAASAGNDTMDGGADNDNYDASGSTGPITVDLSNNTATGADIGDDTITNFEGATGGAAGDTLTGDGGDNTFDGAGGDDTIDGGDGNDSLTGGDGEDTIDGGAGNDSIAAGDNNDTILASSGNDTIDGGGAGSGPGIPGDNDILVIQQADVPVGGSFDIVYSGGDDEDGTVNILDAGGNTVSTITFTEIEEIVCFTRGTMIDTPNGKVAIEDLSEGDLVETRDHGAQAVRWIGSNVVKAKGKKAPVMIKAGALGNDRDLRVSQLHRMLITDWRAELMFDEPEVLAAAKFLVNGDTIFVEENSDETIEYFHMLFDSHEIVTANGAATESFHPGEQGVGWMAEETREEIFEIFPELRVELNGYGDAARTSLKAYEAKALKR